MILVLACSELAAPRLLISGPPPQPDDRPIQSIPPRFTSSDACRACHPREYDTWHASFHRTMTQVVTPETVLAPWEGELHLRQQRFVLERRGDEFWVEMTDPQWEGEGAAPRVWKEIVMSTGSHHAQAYWFPSGDSRILHLFLMVYRIDVGRWVPIDAVFIDPPGVYRKSDVPRWNLVCQRCHSTRCQPRISEEEMDTRVAEFGIACEACHGPAAEHVGANQDPLRRYGLHLGEGQDDTIVNPAELPPRRASQVCGQCHGITEPKADQVARWSQHGFTFEPGQNLFSQRELVTEGEEYFWSDGMVRVSGREYNGLLRSPCFDHQDHERILSCFSCHQMHREDGDGRTLEEWRDDQLKPGMEGDRACTQCHAEYLDEQLVAEHTHHAPGPDRPLCYDCHMPHTTWGLLKGIRSHEVSSPSVQESLETGRPNACNLCHLDRTLAWSAEHLESWYGIGRPELSEDERSIAASILWLLTGDAGQRALVAWHMGWAPARRVSGEDWMAPYLAQLLDDPYDGVRFRAHQSLLGLGGFEDLAYDYVGPDHERAQARERAQRLFRERSAPTLDEGTLLFHEGALREDDFRRLLERRNDRPMALAE